LWEARRKVRRWKEKDPSSTTSAAATVQGDDKKKKRKEIHFDSFPTIKSLPSLCKLAGSIFFVMVGEVICYSATLFKVNDCGMLPLAAHNIMLRGFYFFVRLRIVLVRFCRVLYLQFVMGKRRPARIVLKL